MTIKKQAEPMTTDLQSLMNVGPALAKRLYAIGITRPDQITRSTPEKIFEKLEKEQQGQLDRCVLYQLRGAIENTPWWLCKDREQSKDEKH